MNPEEVHLIIQLLIQEADLVISIQVKIKQSQILSLGKELYLVKKSLMNVSVSHILFCESDILFNYNFDDVKESNVSYQSKFVVRRAVDVTLHSVHMIFSSAGELKLTSYD